VDRSIVCQEYINATGCLNTLYDEGIFDNSTNEGPDCHYNSVGGDESNVETRHN
jgi:hypothetical protein